ncbi:STE/STE7 protein kinase [Coniosporium apollinis CBS 100218]|uniref:mitogen-activated protein kinase kinase n=1 Tax=Coniosporium apollinis (strain CBS 100218) TaxID=1168221 RepID=R7YK76_CONA1|nr:STE/STE7 protein kinase [Coniosporium apollinis CBS 100218]EON62283.1 STE/STE7 protein kinase [Coniosporium apollinis CBS 100218]
MASTPDSEFDVNVDSPLESPPPPDSPSGHPTSLPSTSSSTLKLPNGLAAPSSLEAPRLAPRSHSISAGMTPSSTPLGTLNAARRPGPTSTISSRGSGLNVNADIMARIQAVHLGRQGAPSPRIQPPGRQPSGPGQIPASPGGAMAGGVPAHFKMPTTAGKPQLQNFQSAPAVPNLRLGGNKPSLAEKRGMALPGGLPGAAPNGPPAPAGRKRPGLKLSQINGGGDAPEPGAPEQPPAKPQTMMDKYADFLDPKTGSLRFKGKATLNSTGVNFESGKSFSISLDEVDTLDELGKGNYGTVYKVRHSRPKIRMPGQGLAGNKAQPGMAPTSPTRASHEDSSPASAKSSGGTTGAVMAMKEIRLELDDAKFAAIIMELDILHRCVSPYIIDFYGAFFQEGAVYICIEFMDGGSIDKLYGDGIPESVLRKITLATTMGLKSLKDEHNIIHRDVKPTNILMNTRGQVKICDFGVSGNLVASIAKTNIGCQSYMAPERISSGGIAQAGANPGGGTYSVQSDIWSLGLTIIECAMGRYPYPPETYNNIFSQLSAIVDGEPPDLPPEGFSDASRNFVAGCLNKIPHLRPTYAMLLQHAWLAPLLKPQTIAEEDEEDEEDAENGVADLNKEEEKEAGVVDKEVADWVKGAIERRRAGKMGKKEKPALHAAPLDAVVSPGVG